MSDKKFDQFLRINYREFLRISSIVRLSESSEFDAESIEFANRECNLRSCQRARTFKCSKIVFSKNGDLQNLYFASAK